MHAHHLSIRRRATTLLVLGMAALFAVGACGSDDSRQQSSAPAAAPSPTATPAPAATPVPTATLVPTPDSTASAEGGREEVVAFLGAVTAAAQSYLDKVMAGGSGERPIIYTIGQGDVGQGVEDWIAALEVFERTLVDTPIPDEVDAAAIATSAGLEMTRATREWLEGLRQQIDGGGYIDPLLLLGQVDERVLNAEQQRWRTQREVLRNEYEIGQDDVPFPKFGCCGPAGDF